MLELSGVFGGNFSFRPQRRMISLQAGKALRQHLHLPGQAAIVSVCARTAPDQSFVVKRIKVVEIHPEFE